MTTELYAKGFHPSHYLNPISTDANNIYPPTGLLGGLDSQCAPFTQAFDSPVFSTAYESTTNNYPTNSPNPLIGYPGGASYYPNPWVADPAISGGNTNTFKSHWGDSLLQAVDQNGLSAGIDFNMPQNTSKDPDPVPYTQPKPPTNLHRGA